MKRKGFLKKKCDAKSVIVTCSLSQEFRDKQQQFFLSPSACLKKGISLELKEREWGYDIWEKLRKMSDIIAEYSTANDKLRRKIISQELELDLLKTDFKPL